MILNALDELPELFRFADQSSDEEVKLLVRAHPITQANWVLLVLFFALLPLAVAPFLQSLPVSLGFVGLLVCFWYAVLFSVSLTSYFIWYFNIGIITTEKVIDVDTTSVLYSESSSAYIKNIEEIKQSSQGVLSAMFNFGDVMVQTAGEQPNIEFIGAPQPQLIVQTINKLIEDLPHGKPD